MDGSCLLWTNYLVYKGCLFNNFYAIHIDKINFSMFVVAELHVFVSSYRDQMRFYQVVISTLLYTNAMTMVREKSQFFTPCSTKVHFLNLSCLAFWTTPKVVMLRLKVRNGFFCCHPNYPSNPIVLPVHFHDWSLSDDSVKSFGEKRKVQGILGRSWSSSTLGEPHA